MQLNALELRYSTLDSHRSTGISHAVSPLDKMTMASKTVTRSIVVTASTTSVDDSFAAAVRES